MSRLSSDHNSNDRGNPTLRVLLEMDGNIHEQGGGYYIKVVAKEVPPDATRPDGISYSLTLLHNPSGKRVLGYDNAHPVKTASGPAGKGKKSQHHIHRGNRVHPYDFENAEKLLEDFFVDVDKILKKAGVD